MKNITNCILFYPVLALLITFVWLFGVYEYSFASFESTITQQAGSPLMQSDISVAIADKKNDLQYDFLQIYIVTSLSILFFFYLYYRYFITKLLLLERVSSQLKSSVKQNGFKSLRNFSLDTLIDRLTQTTKDLTLLSRVMQNSNDSILITDENKSIIYVNHAFEKMSGYSADEVMGKEPGSLLRSKVMDAQFYTKMWESIHTSGKFQSEIIDRRKDGTSFTAWQTIWMLKDPLSEQVTHYVAMSKDISELMQKQKEIEKLAYYDGLTNLANRSYFLHLLNNLILQNNRNMHPFAIIYADLDDFKEINDTLGHSAGDKVLQQFSHLLIEELRAEDIICRLGGDEFAIIISDIKTPDDALEIANKIIVSVKKPFLIDEKIISISISIGIALYPEDGIDQNSLLSAADLAMYKSKAKGKNQATLFQEDMQKEANSRVEMREELKNAIEKKEFILHYQPKVDTKSGQIVGFEALIRWKHPKYGLIPPHAFIPIAEESGLIVPMTEWIFTEVNSVCPRFKEVCNYPFSISINISAKHFQGQNLIFQIKSSIEKQWIENGYIELEVTESAVMEDIIIAKEQLDALHALGIKVSLDDYGTGHSSLAYLKYLPIDAIKIDKSFVDGLVHDKKDRAIVYSTIELAKSLEIITIVEGVETKEQVEYIKDFGADYIQGYFYFKPLDEKDVIKICSHPFA